MTTAPTPFFLETISLYRKWSSRVAVYAIVFVLSTAVALLLDRRFGLPPATVLLYTAGLITILMFAVPATQVALRRLSLSLVSRIGDNRPGFAYSTYYSRGLLERLVTSFSLPFFHHPQHDIQAQLEGIQAEVEKRLAESHSEPDIQANHITLLRLKMLENEAFHTQMSVEVAALVNQLIGELRVLNEEVIRVNEENKERGVVDSYQRGRAEGLEETTIRVIILLRNMLTYSQSFTIGPSEGEVVTKEGIRFFRRKT